MIQPALTEPPYYKRGGAAGAPSKRPLDPALKYRLYQHSVQAPDCDVRTLENFYCSNSEADPVVLREDFCGTFLLACEWLRTASNRRALALDIDPEPLRFGRERNLQQLPPSARKRLSILQQDVRSSTRPRADIICALNFSFYIFKTPGDLLKYFKCCHTSLARGGMLAFDMVGGPAFEAAPRREQRSYRYLRGRCAGREWFTYFWRHHYFNHRTRCGSYAIDFKLASGSYYRDVFTYDWRVWSLSEVRTALKQAGFKQIRVFQQTNGKESYEAISAKPKDPCWICYIAAYR